MKVKTLGLVGTAIVMYAVSAFAHHSFAPFDMKKKVTLKGAVEISFVHPASSAKR
jgi:hypothetical protein